MRTPLSDVGLRVLTTVFVQSLCAVRNQRDSEGSGPSILKTRDGHLPYEANVLGHQTSERGI